MNPSATHPDPAADERASLWAARLDGSELSTADRAALTAWLEQHPLHRTLLSQYCQLSTDLERDLPLLASVRDQTDPLPVPRRRVTAGWSWAAAAAAVAAVVAFLMVVVSSDPAPRAIASAVGQRQELTLEDGSRLELNAQTRIVVTMTAAERRVRLAGGQAYFAVKAEADRPFIIDTPAGSVRVTGTEFDVRTDAAVLEVLVVHGSVRVQPSTPAGQPIDSVQLRAGQRLRATGSGAPSVQSLSTEAVADALAWRQGFMVLDGTPLREALERFSQYHGRGLRATEAAGSIALGGRYRLDDLDGFLSSLEEVWPVQVVHQSNGTVQVRLRQDR